MTDVVSGDVVRLIKRAQEIIVERDELRAENERLRDDLGRSRLAGRLLEANVERLKAERIAFLGQGAYSHFQELEAEVERLQALNERLRQSGFAEAEKVERLREYLGRHHSGVPGSHCGCCDWSEPDA